jgi:hypothetical protein
VEFSILLLIIFILLPLLEKLLKAGRPPQQDQQQDEAGLPPRRRTPPAEEQEQLHAGPRSPPAGDEDEAAAAMLPDDLWEILTGERRPRAEPRPMDQDVPVEPRQTPAAAPPQPDREPILGSRPEPVRTRTGPDPRERRLPPAEKRPLPRAAERRLPSVEMRRARPAEAPHRRPAAPPPSAADKLVRKVKVHEPPTLVPMMGTTIEDSDVRRARFHERLASGPPAATIARRGVHAYAFGSSEELRRAIVLREVLGPPKGLEHD